MTLITSKLIKSKVMNIVWLFQEDLKKLQKYSNEKSSRFIINTIKLINVDYNLHKIKRLVQIDSEWMKKDQAQIKKRVNHLQHHEKTITYDLRCVDSRIKMLIYDRQNCWMCIMKLTLKLKIFENDDVIKDVEDDDDDKVNDDEVNNKMKDDNCV